MIWMLLPLRLVNVVYTRTYPMQDDQRIPLADMVIGKTFGLFHLFCFCFSVFVFLICKLYPASSLVCFLRVVWFGLFDS